MLINTWLISVRLSEVQRRDRDYIARGEVENVMTNCCNFVKNENPNLDLQYRVLGATEHAEK